MIEYASGGETGQGYLAGEGGQGPAVLVIQEWWGLVPHIKDVCDRFAAQGFVALAPDLYRGRAAKEPDEAAKMMMAMKLDEAAADMSAALDELLRRTGRAKAGVTGFCMGGGLALVLAAKRPDAIAAAVPFYGTPFPDLDLAAITAAVQGHYAEHDDFAGPKVARELEDTLRANGRTAEFFVYPGTHTPSSTTPGPRCTPRRRPRWPLTAR